MGPINTLKNLLPKGASVMLNYEDCEPEPITGHRMTRLNGPQIRLHTRWYYLSQIRGGSELLKQFRMLEAAALAQLV